MGNENNKHGNAKIFGRIWQYYVLWAEAIESHEVAARAGRVSEVEQEFAAFGHDKSSNKLQNGNKLDLIF